MCVLTIDGKIANTFIPLKSILYLVLSAVGTVAKNANPSENYKRNKELQYAVKPDMAVIQKSTWCPPGK